MNFSGISTHTFLGKALRQMLVLIPKTMELPIIQGPLRGYKWTVGSGIHGYWLGSFELEKQERFCEMVKRGMTVYDLGAHAGYYTLLASKLIGQTGRVIAFEPDVVNSNHLKKHIARNGCRNVTVFEAAVSDKDGLAKFERGKDSSTGRLCDRGSISVSTVTIDGLCQQKVIPEPDILKIDVEGGEFQALLGAINVLRKKKPTIFLATHGFEVRRKCLELLEDLNYKMSEIRGCNDELLAEPSELPRKQEID